MKTLFIYVARNKLDGKRYVGCTTNPKARFRHYRGAAKKNFVCWSGRLVRAIKEYGAENFSFEIIAECSNPWIAKEIEQSYITLFKTRNPECGYNRHPAILVSNMKGKLSQYKVDAQAS